MTRLISYLGVQPSDPSHSSSRPTSSAVNSIVYMSSPQSWRHSHDISRHRDVLLHWKNIPTQEVRERAVSLNNVLPHLSARRTTRRGFIYMHFSIISTLYWRGVYFIQTTLLPTHGQRLHCRPLNGVVSSADTFFPCHPRLTMTTMMSLDDDVS